MWEEAPPDVGNELRQGDFLHGVLLPTLALPLPFIRVGDAPLTTGAQAVVPAKARDFVVVSQCCTAENGDEVALSPVRQTAAVSSEDRLAYFWERPEDAPEGAEVKFAYSAMAIDAIPGVLDAPTGDRLRVINFEDVKSYAGDSADFRSRRVARMTPAGRRRLRLRLMYFWGRVEEEDAAVLNALGLDSG